MPQAGVPARARRRSATPWWEELDRDAFQFPTEHRVKPARRAVAVAERPVAAAAPPAAAPPAAARAPQPARPSASERRTVTIRGRGAERNLPVARPTLRRHERPGFKADRAALWAVMLGLLLILVAATSAHAAILH
jgi:hypothetical protein